MGASACMNAVIMSHDGKFFIKSDDMSNANSVMVAELAIPYDLTTLGEFTIISRFSVKPYYMAFSWDGNYFMYKSKTSSTLYVAELMHPYDITTIS